MSSELTLDIQLTELGFSNWNFQLLQKDGCPASETEHDAASTSLMSSLSGKTHVDDEADVSLSPVTSVTCPNSPGVHSSQIDSAEKSSEDAGLKNNKRKRGKRKKNSDDDYYYYDDDDDDDDDDDLVEEKKKKKKLNEHGRTKRKFSKSEISEEEDDGNDEYSDDYEMTENEEEINYSSTDTSGAEEHRCPVCNLSFSSSFLLQEHLLIHSGVRLYSCAECGKQFCHLKNYRIHLRSHNDVDTIKCIICTAPFATQADLQQHLDTNHFEEEFYQCDLCKRIFTTMERCQRHVLTHMHHPKCYPCPKCKRSFSEHRSMLDHLKRHKKAKLVCKDCGMAFTRKVWLLRHSFSHLGLMPFTCVRCNQHFRLYSQYRKHECIPEKLQCVACLVIFRSEEDFEKHKKDTGCWGHQTAPSDGAIDIRCMECGKVFDNSEDLKKHAGTHQRVMRCSECGKGFRSSFMLMSHMGGHAAQRPVLCKECGLGFCHQQGYDLHLKTCGIVSPEAAVKKPKPRTNSIHPVIPVGSQIKVLEPLFNVTSKNNPTSPVSVVMLMPVQSSESILDAKNPVLATHGTKVSVSSNSSVLKTEFENSPLPQENASSKLLIPLSTENDNKRWTVMNQPSSSKTYTLYTVKNDEERAQSTRFISLNAQNGQKKVFTAPQILDNIKKKQGTNEENANLPTVVIPGTLCENIMPGLSRLEDKKSSTESSVAIEAPSMGSDMQGNEKLNLPSPEIGSSEKILKVSEIKEPEQLVCSKPSIISLPESPNLKGDKSRTEKRVEKPSEAKNCGNENIPQPLLQCEICGKMLMETDLGQQCTDH